MKRQSKRSYADQAKFIVRKFKKRLGENFERSDPMAEKEMQRQLDELAERQEEAKQRITEQQFQEMPDQMAYGGCLPKMWAGGDVYVDMLKNQSEFVQPLPNTIENYNPYFNQRAASYDRNNNDLVSMSLIRANSGFIPRQANRYLRGVQNSGNGYNLTADQFSNSDGAQKMPIIQPNINSQNTSLTSPYKVGNNIPDDPQQQEQSWWSQIPTETKIGAGIQAAGAIGGLAMSAFNKPKKSTFNPVAAPKPKFIDNDEQLAQATRAYRGRMSDMRYLSPSQYMAAMGSMAAQEAATKAGIVENTANTNAGIENQFGWQKAALQQANEQGRLGVEQYNNANEQGYLGNISQGLSNISNVGAGFMKDELSRKAQQDALGFQTQPGYGITWVGNRPIRTVMPAPGFEYYTHPKTGNKTWMINGQPVDPKEYNAKLKEYWDTHRYEETNPKEKK